MTADEPHKYESGVFWDTAPEDVISCCQFGPAHPIHDEESVLRSEIAEQIGQLAIRDVDGVPFSPGEVRRAAVAIAMGRPA